MKQSPSKYHHQQRSLRAVLSNTAICLQTTNELISNLEGDFLGNGLPSMSNSAQIAKIQTIDLISQTLDEISALLKRIANEAPPEQYVCYKQIVAPVKLEGLRNRISGERDTSATAISIKQGNPIELF